MICKLGFILGSEICFMMTDLDIYLLWVITLSWLVDHFWLGNDITWITDNKVRTGFRSWFLAAHKLTKNLLTNKYVCSTISSGKFLPACVYIILTAHYLFFPFFNNFPNNPSTRKGIVPAIVFWGTMSPLVALPEDEGRDLFNCLDPLVKQKLPEIS